MEGLSKRGQQSQSIEPYLDTNAAARESPMTPYSWILGRIDRSATAIGWQRGNRKMLIAVRLLVPLAQKDVIQQWQTALTTSFKLLPRLVIPAIDRNSAGFIAASADGPPFVKPILAVNNFAAWLRNIGRERE